MGVMSELDLILARVQRIESLKQAIEEGAVETPFSGQLLSLPNQQTAFATCQTFSFSREPTSDFYGTHWFCCGDLADWVGFMDDYGTFWAVDWC